jgi:GntR family phosphonate transport system transcriptional regulator
LSGVPVYQQIAERLEQEIQEAYQPDQALPSERGLAEQFGVNRHTIRHAIDRLVQKGILERRQGSGVYVLDNLFDYPINQKTRFTTSFEALGQSAQSEVLVKELVPAPDDVAKALKIKAGAQVAKIDCLRLVNDHPFCASTHFITGKICKPIVEKYEGDSLHEFVRQEFELELSRMQSRVTAILPDKEDARLLKMSANFPVLRVKSVNVNRATGRPVEFAVTRFRGDRTRLSIDLKDEAIGK